MSRRSRSFSLVAALLEFLISFVCAVRLLSFWRSLKWEVESEWEGSAEAWRVDGVKLAWGLLSAYFCAGAFSCFIGLIGLLRSVPSFVRLYRDWSIADLVFITSSVLIATYASFSTAFVRTGVCEELSRQPELMRDLGEVGLSLENCELWIERALFAILGITFIMMFVRLHIVIAVSKYYNHMHRELGGLKPHPTLRQVEPDTMQRIYLLPTPTSPSAPPPYNFNHFTRPRPHGRSKSMDEFLVYAPVPVGGLSEQDALEMHATEAWISTRPDAGSHAKGHRHTHSHGAHLHRHGLSRILLPTYREEESSSGDEKLPV